MKIWRGLAMAVCVAAGARASDAQLHVGKDNRMLEVSGVGTASAEPEIAKVHVGFTIYGASLRDGYKKASDLSSAIAGALNGAGVAKGDVESKDQGIVPLREDELKELSGSLKGMRYRVTQSWTVRVAIDQVAKVLNAAVDAGANDSGQVEWLMKDSTALERQAVSRATARARALAEEMAAGMGVKLGPLVYVTTQPDTYFMLAGTARNSVAADGVSYGQSGPLSIGARRVERSMTVKAVYAIE